MKLSCDVIKDLLPLYVEHITSEDSNQLVQEHLKGCASCTAYEQELKEETTSNSPSFETMPLKYVQKDMKKRRRNSVIFISLIVAFVMFVLFSYLTKPRFLTKNDSGVRVETVDGIDLYINFSNNVTSSKVTREEWENGKRVVIVEAWTSVWDVILGKSTPSLNLSNVEGEVDSIYYCSNKEENGTDNMALIYGEDPNPSGGVVVLPRLVMGYYFSLLCVAVLVLGVLWLLFRKKKKASSVLTYAFFVPVSYLIAQILLGVGFTTFTAQRDFIMILIGAVMVYGICILGGKMLWQRRRDKEAE